MRCENCPTTDEQLLDLGLEAESISCPVGPAREGYVNEGRFAVLSGMTHCTSLEVFEAEFSKQSSMGAPAINQTVEIN